MKPEKTMIKKSIVKLTVFMAAVTAVALLTGSIYFRSNVFIDDNGFTAEAKTNKIELADILEEQGITVGEHDLAELTSDGKNTYIKITRAFNVFINVDGRKITVPVLGGTAIEAVKKAGIILGEFDELSCANTADAVEDMEISVTRVSFKEREEDVSIPFEIEYVDNTNKKIGTETKLNDGVDGESHKVWKDKYVNGVLEKSELISETVTAEPVNEKIERGTACAVPYAKMADPSALTLVDGIPADYTRIVSGKATSYSARPGAGTASGRKAVVGTVAVNPNVIPYGSELYIVSQDRKTVYGYAIAADTGDGMMEGTVAVDVFAANYADSCKWGAHYVDIFVITEGKG